jgi:hypothetical protein
LATPNYGYEKRQRELAKKSKKAEKLREKADRKVNPDAPAEGNTDAVQPPPTTPPVAE